VFKEKPAIKTINSSPLQKGMKKGKNKKGHVCTGGRSRDTQEWIFVIAGVSGLT